MVPGLLALLLVTLPAQTPAQVPATAPVTAESLIPANALSVMRIRSIDAVEKAAQSIVPGVKVGDQILGFLPMAVLAPVPADQVDRASPILLVAVPSQVRPPVEPMLILTCKDPAAFTAPLEKMGWTCTVSGKVVACSASKPGPTLAADAPMRIGLDRNDIVLRVAMEQAMSQFGELIKAGLDNAAQQAESEIPDEAAADQVTSMLTGLSDALDEIEILEINLSQRADQTRLGFEMTALEGTSLAKVEKVDASALPTAARAVDEGGAMSMIVAMDFSKIMGVYQGFMDAALKSMPEDQRAMMSGITKMTSDLYSSIGTTMAGGFDFGTDGMRGTFFMNPKDPAGYLAKLTQVFVADVPWMNLTKSEHTQVDGVDVSTLHFTMDMSAFPMPGADTALSTPEGKAEFDKGMQAMFGPGGIRYSMAAVNGAVIGAIGDVGQMKSAIARMSSKSPSPLGAELLKEMGGMNPGFVFRMDVGRYMANMSGALAGMAGSGEAEMTHAMEMFRSMPPIQVAGGVEGRVWKLGISTDVAKFVAAATQMRSMAPKTGSTARGTSATHAKARADIVMIVNALNEFAMNNAGKYPDNLQVLVTPDMNGKRYLEMQKLPLDPWGHAYVYTAPTPASPEPHVSSLGADGRVGGTGENADIDNLSEDRDDR